MFRRRLLHAFAGLALSVPIGGAVAIGVQQVQKDFKEEKSVAYVQQEVARLI